MPLEDRHGRDHQLNPAKNPEECERPLSRLSSIKEQFTSLRLNIYFSILCFFCPPVMGSVVSFVFNGGGLWSTFQIALKNQRLNADRPMVAMTAVIYAYCGANVLASIVNNSIARDAPFLVSLITFLFFPFSYSVWSISPKATLVRIFVLASMGACYGALLLAVVQYHWFGMRAEGGAGNAIVFATVTCLSAMVCLAGALSGMEKARALLVGAVLAGAIAIVYSGTRIIWLAIAIAAITVLLIYRDKLRGRNAVRILAIVAAIGVAVAVFGYQIISTRTGSLFTDSDALVAHGDYSTALGLRVALWHIGLGLFREIPFFGHGMGATEFLIKQGFQNQFGTKDGFSHFHNGFLTALVQAGILGAVTLAGIFVVAVHNASRVLRTSIDPIERFGATMIVILAITYLTAGMTGILIGHDILDSVLMIFLVSGTYLASGTCASAVEDRILPATPADR